MLLSAQEPIFAVTILRWGAHAPSRAVVGALADHIGASGESPFSDWIAQPFRPAGRQSEHARARVLPISDDVLKRKLRLVPEQLPLRVQAQAPAQRQAARQGFLRSPCAGHTWLRTRHELA